MGEELQHLIDRIRTEALSEAETEGGRIVAEAREKAAATVKDAEAKAKALLAKADRDAKVFVERGERTLEQAARDLLITVGQGVEHVVEDIVGEALDEAMDIGLLQQMLLKIAEGYCRHQGTESRIEYLIGKEDQAAVVKFFASQYRRHLLQGVSIHTDDGILKGFRMALRDDHAYHDFTKPAIAEALGNFLRPHLAEIVHRAAREAGGDEEAPAKDQAGAS